MGPARARFSPKACWTLGSGESDRNEDWTISSSNVRLLKRPEGRGSVRLVHGNWFGLRRFGLGLVHLSLIERQAASSSCATCAQRPSLGTPSPIVHTSSFWRNRAIGALALSWCPSHLCEHEHDRGWGFDCVGKVSSSASHSVHNEERRGSKSTSGPLKGEVRAERVERQGQPVSPRGTERSTQAHAGSATYAWTKVSLSYDR